MKYIVMGLLIVVNLSVGLVGAGVFISSISLAIEQRDPAYLLGLLITAVCVAGCAKIMDYLCDNC